MPTLDEMIANADRIAAESRALAKDLRDFKKLQARTGGHAIKGPDGKLTEQGVRVLEAAFAAGKSPSDIARSMGISVPAVLYRKRNWETAQRGRRR